MVDLPLHEDARGKLVVLEAGKEIEFDVKRAYYIFDVPKEAVRGGHGHRRLRQVVIALAGSFDMIVDDGSSTARYTLDSPARGLFIGEMIWRQMVNFSSGAIGLWLVSEQYDADEYYRDYDEFLTAARALR